MIHLRRFVVIGFTFAVIAGCTNLHGAELVTLTAETWDEFAPAGKEVDAIYGDYVMRNDQIVAVIAHPRASRHANLTVHNVGGAMIDLTRRHRQNDQLSAFYPGASQFTFTGGQLAGADAGLHPVEQDLRLTGKSVSYQCRATATAGKPEVAVRYTLTDGQPFLSVETTYTNRSSEAVALELTDAVRADRTFQFGLVNDDEVFWAHDDWFRQAYGVAADGYKISHSGNRRILLAYLKDGDNKVTLPAGGSFKLSRKVFPADNTLRLRAIVNQLTGVQDKEVTIRITDAAGPVNHARVTLTDGERIYGSASTGEDGQLSFALLGRYHATIKALGRPDKVVAIDVSQATEYDVQLDTCGYVVANITDETGGPIPCKVAFHGIEGTETPYFGPDSAAVGVHNLHYSHTGKFRQEIAPGKYEVIVSYGPEYDAVVTSIEVQRGRETQLSANLRRVVDTTGWVSSDFHSHSSPSGDNTTMQIGRVLNLLCEHIEFAPCTEHNRIDTYVPHLKQLGAERLMATCTGIELTGSPLPVNHQNAFPLIHKPHTQDGGAPQVHGNPLVQIERLALWDDGSDKLVQGNHPNIPTILGDRDNDGKPDGGFERMFGFMDVIEVHPPGTILLVPKSPQFQEARRNPIFHWMQLLNLGYRIPGVVNTDAHYDFHGSGWLRNFIKSPTDDPSQINTMDIVHAAEHGQMIMSTGPFMQAKLKALNVSDKPHVGGPGDDLTVPDGEAELWVRVQCPNWLDVNRVQVFLNGRMDEKLNFTRRTTPEVFSDEVVKFEATIPLHLGEDTHVIVAAAGEGLQLGRVMGPGVGQVMPVAVSNPIFVDVDGGGFKSNGDDLGVPLPLRASE